MYLYMYLQIDEYAHIYIYIHKRSEGSMLFFFYRRLSRTLRKFLGLVFIAVMKLP